MLKVYLSGFKAPYAVIGEFLTEDERYLIIKDGNIKRKLPHDRIVHIEDIDISHDLESIGPYKLDSVKHDPRKYAAKEMKAPQEQFEKEPAKVDLTAEKMNPNKLNNILKSGLKSAMGLKNDMVEVATKADRRDLNIIVSGVVQDTFKINVPGNSFAPNIYTPSLAKEVALHPDVKRIMDGGIIFSGVPTVVGDTIHIETARLSDRIKSAAEGVSLASKVADSMAKFKKPDRAFSSEFSMLGKTQFAFKNSPFSGPVPLSDDDEEEAEVEDESSGQEETSGEGPTEEGVS